MPATGMFRRSYEKDVAAKLSVILTLFFLPGGLTCLSKVRAVTCPVTAAASTRDEMGIRYETAVRATEPPPSPANLVSSGCQPRHSDQ